MRAYLDPPCDKVMSDTWLETVEFSLEDDWVVLASKVVKIVIQLLNSCHFLLFFLLLFWLFNLHVIVSIKLRVMILNLFVVNMIISNVNLIISNV